MKRADASLLNRRKALGLLGAGAGVGLMTRWGGLASLAAQAGGASRMPPTPKGAIIRTILKDLPPSGLGNGSVLFHEHLSFNSGFFERMRPANAPKPAAIRAAGKTEAPAAEGAE